MTIRERIARAMLMRAKKGDLFFDMSMSVREAALDNLLPAFEALADEALNELTAPPTSDMVTAGCNAMKELRLHISAASKPSRVGLRAGWESMVRTMIEEGKK